MDGCPCPAVATGRSPGSDDGSLYVAEQYDEILRDKLEKDEGTVPEELAREAWLDAVEIIEGFNDYRTRDSLETGQEIADELGWL